MNNDYNNNQQQYQQPQYQPPMPNPPGKSAATASMICGIISLAAAWFGWGALLGLALGVVAIVTSINAKKQGFVGGMAQAGFIMGIIGAVLSGIVFITCVACACALGSGACAAGNVDWSSF